jgi:Helix-turn-helix domain
MPDSKGGMLLGFKAICLSRSLKDGDRPVAAAILDHYNHKTGQCDPSLGTIAFLVGCSRRTVIRRVNALVRAGFFRRIRHGGKFHRNLYEPAWTFFEQLETAWKKRRRENTTRRLGRELSHSQGQQSCHIAGASEGTQTYQTNISKETSLADPPETKIAAECTLDVPRHPRKPNVFQPNYASSQSAAYDAAERRWVSALQNQYLSNPQAYAHLIDSIDSKLHQETTARELQQRGSGLTYILEQVRRRPSKGDLP